MDNSFIRQKFKQRKIYICSMCSFHALMQCALPMQIDYVRLIKSKEIKKCMTKANTFICHLFEQSLSRLIMFEPFNGFIGWILWFKWCTYGCCYIFIFFPFDMKQRGFIRFFRFPNFLLFPKQCFVINFVSIISVF